MVVAAAECPDECFASGCQYNPAFGEGAQELNNGRCIWQCSQQQEQLITEVEVPNSCHEVPRPPIGSPADAIPTACLGTTGDVTPPLQTPSLPAPTHPCTHIQARTHPQTQERTHPHT